MLKELKLENYLFVESAQFFPGTGFTVISGETGAGKSVLVGAITLIFGEGSAIPEAFDPNKPVSLESIWLLRPHHPLFRILEEDGDSERELSIAREINFQGKSTFFLDGRRSSLAVIRALKPYLIDFHHQRDQQQLLNNNYQLQILDLYASHSDLVDEFGKAYRGLNKLLRKLNDMRNQQTLQSQMMELYRFQADELEKANLYEGEDGRLQQEYDLLSQADEIKALVQGTLHDLYETENSVFDRVSGALSRIVKYADLDACLAELESSLNHCVDALHNSADLLRRCDHTIATDPGRGDEIRQRLDLINQLKQKYRLSTITDLLQYQRKILSEMDAYTDCAEAIKAMEDSIYKEFECLTKLAAALSSSRHQAAKRLCSDLVENIRHLAIPHARFEIQIDKKTEGNIVIPDFLSRCDASGTDSVDFRFSGNLGSTLKPLKAVVSGGELSRILLAIKKVLAQKLYSKLIILDEIDAGIGGKTAEHLADYIHQIAAHHQVLVITHLAQIAAAADTHIMIDKHSEKAKTRIVWLMLDEDQRKHEIARMLSGKITEHSMKHADELINR